MPTTKTHTKTLTELLSDLVRIPTLTDDHAANHQGLEYVADYLKARGMHVRHYEPTDKRNEALIASTRADNYKTPTVLLAAHMDVVAAPDEMFTLRREGDKFFGRGVLDMKCSIAAYMKVVDDLGESLSEYDFAIIITSDEEIAGRDGVNATIQFTSDGYLPQMVVLPDGGQNWQLETISNGYMHYTMEARGKTAHSSRPWLGENATEKLIDALHEIRAHFREQGPETDTCNIATIETPDIPANQVPDFATTDLSIRLKHRGRLAHWVKVLQDACDKHDVTLIQRAVFDVAFNDLGNPFVQRFADITTEVTGVTVAGFHSYAGSDARFYAEAGVPYANTYPMGGGHHSADEWLSVQALDQLKEIVQRYIEQTARDR